MYIGGGDPNDINHTPLRTMTFKLQQRTIQDKPKTDQTFAQKSNTFDPSVFSKITADIVDSSRASSTESEGGGDPHVALQEQNETDELLGLHEEQFLRDVDVEDLPVNQDREELIGGGNFIRSTSSTLLNAAGLTQERFDGSVEEVDNLNEKRLMLNPNSRCRGLSSRSRRRKIQFKSCG